MNLVLQPSLEHRALVKMAVSLWNQNDVGALISSVKVQYRGSLIPRKGEWMEIEARVLERVAQLPLPQLLKGKVSCFIQTVGLEILQWIYFHCIHNHLPHSLPLELCWTPQGTVDRKRTAEVLVKDESLDIATRYVLACIYCLEDDIIALWNTLSEDLKQSFLCEDSPNIANRDQEWIIVFWSHTMKVRELRNARTSYKDGFEQCAREVNKVAVEYFLQKLTPQEREELLVETAKIVEGDVLCFLLSEMDKPQQQIEVYKKNPLGVLRTFLQWPFQSFFIEIANCMWDFLPKGVYECMLREIIHKVENGYKDCNYQKLFTEFWQKSPHALKSLITNDLDKSDLLQSLCRIKDKENIQLLLQDATHTAREKLIYSGKIHYFCQDCIRDDEWDSLEFLIRECFRSKDLMLKFKEKFKKRKKQKIVEDKLVCNKHKWDKLFLSSDDSLREYEKRSVNEGESSSSKRFRSLQ